MTFVAFEGIDGSGKTTQLRAVARHLIAQGHQVCCTREPGGTALGATLRDLLLSRRHLDMTPLVELLLFEADRAHHLHTVVEPALARGDIVLCDRYTGSTLAYQGFGRGLDLRLVADLNQIATGGLMPEVTVLCDVDADTHVDPVPGDPFDHASVAFRQRLREGLLHQARHDPSWVTIRSRDTDIDTVTAAIVRHLEPHL